MHKLTTQPISLSIIKFILLLAVLLPLSSISQTAREKEMLKEINSVRTNPQDYIQYIDGYLDYWDACPSERKTSKELINILIKMTPVPALTFSDELYKAAKKHGQYMKRTKRFKHSRMGYAENLVAGNDSIRYAIIDLLIDDGIPSRGHRKNILDPEATVFGCYEVEGMVGRWDYVFIQEFN